MVVDIMNNVEVFIETSSLIICLRDNPIFFI